MRTARPEISVVVPVRNADGTLPALLASLSRQNCDEPFDVIVADDDSTDASIAVAQDFGRELRLTVCESPSHVGIAGARNAGAARSIAPALAFCDADDVVHEAWLRSLCGALRHHALVAGAVHSLPPGTGAGPAAIAAAQPIDPSALNSYYGHLPWTITANLAVRRDPFAEVGGFSEELRTGSDADFCWRLAARGVELAYDPGAIVFKRHRSGAIPTFRQYFAYGRGHPHLYRRHRHAGMPRASPPEVARRYAGTALSVARAVRRPRSQPGGGAAARVGQDLGRLVGSARWRALYL